MSKYDVTFMLPGGTMLIMRMVWEHKHRNIMEFEQDIDRLGRTLGAMYVYKEEVQ